MIKIALWSLFRKVNPTDHNPRRFTKADKVFAKTFDFKGTKCPIKIRVIHKIEKTNSNGICAFDFENRRTHPTPALKNVAKKRMLIYYQ